VDELVAAERNRHMSRPRGDRTEEEQISARETVRRDRLARFELFDDGSREGDSVLSENVLREAAAVEAGWIGTAVAVGRSAERQSSASDRVGIGTSGW
jgi:hypothetical protein